MTRDKPSTTKKNCMTQECDKKAEWKGLCRSCYGQARKLIDDEKTSWEELAQMGMCELDAKPFTQLFWRKKRRMLEVALEEPCPHCNKEKCYEHCRETEDGKHEPDPGSATVPQQSGETDFLVDYNCKHCGISGSVRVDPATIQWE